MPSGNTTFRRTTPKALTTSPGRVWRCRVKAGDYGSFDYGRNYGVLYDVEGWTDMLPEFGGDSYSKADNFYD
ncbi:porin [Enterobacter cancerogenus]|uniref:Porin n=1 Tax=Enterobacter cancerogenus TaxID=69218 RepID=A0A484Z779_9ENTR|nr:porin [Enterobacter cancerogenus]